MSTITDLILITCIDDAVVINNKEFLNVNRINQWLKENIERPADTIKDLLEVSGMSYPGNPILQCDVFIGAYRSFETEELIEVFNAVPWQYPESVMLLIKEEYDESFTTHLPPKVKESINRSERDE